MSSGRPLTESAIRWITLLLILVMHGADLFLTHVYLEELVHGIRETNPWARWMWSQYGTFGLFLVKVLSLGVGLSILSLLWKRDSKWTDFWLAFGFVTMCLVSYWWYELIQQITDQGALL